jgi:hypothetical protein
MITISSRYHSNRHQVRTENSATFPFFPFPSSICVECIQRFHLCRMFTSLFLYFFFLDVKSRHTDSSSYITLLHLLFNKQGLLLHTQYIYIISIE